MHIADETLQTLGNSLRSADVVQLIFQSVARASLRNSML